MLLKDLLSDVPGVLETRGDAEIQALVTDSREKARNGLFFCISGMRFDAHDFAAQAVENGCVALVVERFVDSPVAQVRVDNVRRAAAYIAARSTAILRASCAWWACAAQRAKRPPPI